MRWPANLLLILLAGLAGALLAPHGAPIGTRPEPAAAQRDAASPEAAAPVATPVAAAPLATEDDHCAGCRAEDAGRSTPSRAADAPSARPPHPAFADLAELTVPLASGGLTSVPPAWPERCAVRFVASERVQGQEAEARLAGTVTATGRSGGTVLEWSGLEWRGAPLAASYRVGFDTGRLVVLPDTPPADGSLAAQLVQASRRLLLLRGHWPSGSLTHGQDLDLGGAPYRVVVPTSDRIGLFATACVASDGRYPAASQSRDEITLVCAGRALVSCRHVTETSSPIGSRRTALRITPALREPVAQATLPSRSSGER